MAENLQIENRTLRARDSPRRLHQRALEGIETGPRSRGRERKPWICRSTETDIIRRRSGLELRGFGDGDIFVRRCGVRREMVDRGINAGRKELILLFLRM